MFGISTENVDLQLNNIESVIHFDEERNSKVGEYTATECMFSDAFDAIVEMNRILKRVTKGIIFTWSNSYVLKMHQQVLTR